MDQTEPPEEPIEEKMSPKQLEEVLHYYIIFKLLYIITSYYYKLRKIMMSKQLIWQEQNKQLNWLSLMSSILQHLHNNQMYMSQMSSVHLVNYIRIYCNNLLINTALYERICLSYLSVFFIYPTL